MVKIVQITQKKKNGSHVINPIIIEVNWKMKLNRLLPCEFFSRRKWSITPLLCSLRLPYKHSTGVRRAVSHFLRLGNLCLYFLPRHLPYHRSRSHPGTKEKPFAAEPGKPSAAPCSVISSQCYLNGEHDWHFHQLSIINLPRWGAYINLACF